MKLRLKRSSDRVADGAGTRCRFEAQETGPLRSQFMTHGDVRLGEVLEEPDGLRITLLGHEPHFYGGEAIN